MNMKQALMWKNLGFKAVTVRYCFIVQELVKWLNLTQKTKFLWEHQLHDLNWEGHFYPA